MATDETYTGSSSGNPDRGAKGPRGPVSGAVAAIVGCWRFIVYVLERFRHDGCQPRAAALTFTSLLAFVPLLAVSFAIFAAFPAYRRLKDELQSAIFDNLVPQVGSVVQEHFDQFTQQTGGLTAIGVLFLVFTSILMLTTISNTFNHIWRVRQARSLVARLVVFWAVITLTPLLFGASLSISSYLFTAAQETGVEAVTGPIGGYAFMAPFLLQAAGFTMLFLIMPNYPVRRTDALIGGLVASTLFELLKKGFGLYIASFPTYETIYGAMATIPIFLVWVYLSWTVVLIAAELTASLPEWRGGARKLRKGSLAPLDRLMAALGVLSALRQVSIDGGGLREHQLVRLSGVGRDASVEALDRLQNNRYIERGERGHWLLVRDLSQVTLFDLYNHLGLGLGTRLRAEYMNKAWARRFADIRQTMTDQSREIMEVPLSELLAPAAPGELHAIEMDDDEDGELGPAERTRSRQSLLSLLGIGTVSAGS